MCSPRKSSSTVAQRLLPAFCSPHTPRVAACCHSGILGAFHPLQMLCTRGRSLPRGLLFCVKSSESSLNIDSCYCRNLKHNIAFWVCDIHSYVGGVLPVWLGWGQATETESCQVSLVVRLQATEVTSANAPGMWGSAHRGKESWRVKPSGAALLNWRQE